MASGGHHDGGFHTGDYHSDGLGGFGDGLGGDLGGKGYHSNDDYGGGSGRSSYVPYGVPAIFTALLVLCLFVLDVWQGTGYYKTIAGILSLNIVKLVVLGVSCFFIIKGCFIGTGMKALTMNPITRKINLKDWELTGKISLQYSGLTFAEKIRLFLLCSVDKATWGQEPKSFRIWLDEDCESNKRALFELVRRTPRILWIDRRVWIVGFILGLVINPLFYPLVIPVFEHMLMDDVTFAVIDKVVFYFPVFICLVFGILCFVTTKVKLRLLYQLDAQIDSQFMLKYTQAAINKELSNRKYHDVCPNCGAENTGSLYYCSVCGSSLEITSDD